MESTTLTENNNDNSQKKDETPPSPVVSDMQEVNKKSQDESEVEYNNIQCNTDISHQYNESTVDPESKTPLKRSVTFPGECLVAGYLEPPDPWKNVQQWTSDDLINSYKVSCKKHNTKPINSILNQLQGIENVGERYAILSLKGEKLDMKNVETLEEILKFVQFQCVDLEATHLDEETSVAIFEMIEYYESACKVNISFNKNISIRGWQSCARMIRKTPCLTFLDARSCDINERLLPFLGRALKMGCFLKILHLENTYLSGRALVILVAALKMNEILKELFLADNRLMPTDGMQLGNLLRYNHVLELLDLRNNQLQDIGVGHVSDGLYEQNLDQGLNTLVLWNNQMSYQAMSAISKALTSTTRLETINLGHNNITNEGIHLLKEGLLQNKSLLRIGLQGTKITCEGSVALAEVIADSPKLVRVDLRENEIKTAGMMALSLALKVNDILQRLDLDKETKKETGIKDYADQQKRLQQDINKKLEENREVFYKLEQEKSIKEKEIEKDKDKESSENDSSYIESCDKVKRPMLLVMPDCPPEMSLDSPHCTEESVDYIPFPASNSIITTPPGDLLLSPQYCPSVKARKIFTVSQVKNSSLSSPVKNSPLSPPAISVSLLLPSVDIPTALPNSLPVVPLQPVIVASSNDIANECDPDVEKIKRGDLNMASLPKMEPVTVSDLSNALVDESVNHILNQIICNEPNYVKDTVITNKRETVSLVNDNKEVTIDTNISHVNVVITDIDANCDEKTLQNVQSNIDPCSTINNSDAELKKNNNISNHSERSKLTNGCDVLTSKNVIEQTGVRDLDFGVGSYDCEQWTNVEDSVKPNFQTSFTLNGLTKELESAIEGLDVSPDVMQSTESLSTPDDFERELDAMIANVKGGSNLLLGVTKTDSEV